MRRAWAVNLHKEFLHVERPLSHSLASYGGACVLYTELARGCARMVVLLFRWRGLCIALWRLQGVYREGLRALSACVRLGASRVFCLDDFVPRSGGVIHYCRDSVRRRASVGLEGICSAGSMERFLGTVLVLWPSGSSCFWCLVPPHGGAFFENFCWCACCGCVEHAAS